MNTEKNDNPLQKFLKTFLLWFVLFYLGAMTYQRLVPAQPSPGEHTNPTISITPVKQDFIIGQRVEWQITNQLSETVQFFSPCESESERSSLQLFRQKDDNETLVSDFQECKDLPISDITLQAGESANFDLRAFQDQFLAREGTYVLEMTFQRTESDPYTVRSSIVTLDRPGAIRQLFRAIVSRPLFNLLVFFMRFLPGHSFGWAVVLLTLVVRLVLFFPNQKAMKSQRELQKLQPKLQEIKDKYKNDQQTQALKTMELYRVHKINPMSSCLPILLQFPFLIGVYYLVREGISPHLLYLLYDFQQGVDLTQVDVQFFGLNLLVPNKWILPFIVAGAQWGALRLSFIKQKKRKSDSNALAEKSAATDPNAQMQLIMQWMMPVMIGFFTAAVPSAVGIYWLTSTLFGIGQQEVVNRQVDHEGEVIKKVS